jgi:hypothetical protein
VTDCTFTDNTADNAGGGMHLTESNVTVTGTRFIGNRSLNPDGGGGAMVNITAVPTVTNCLFAGNEGAWGAALLNWDGGDTTVINCTFAGNVASPGGGAMWSGSISHPAVSNSIFWDNIGGAIVDEIDSSTTVGYSDVQGGFAGIGNIDADPVFADADGRLSTGSPCIDAGHNWMIAGLATTDLDGNPRFAADESDFDPGCGIPVVVDMGAYEYQGDPFDVKLGDIDGDGVVGITDFLLLLGTWGPCVETCCLADLDLDGLVGITDFLILLAKWG